MPRELRSAVNKLADRKPKEFYEVMAMGMSSMTNPIHQKMTPEHISQVLDLAAKHDEREYDLHKKSQDNDFADRKADRAYCFGAFAIMFILVVTILWLFKDKTEVLIPSLTGVGGLAGGFLGGWGFGQKRN